MSRKTSQASLLTSQKIQPILVKAETIKAQNGGCILPGFDKPIQTAPARAHRMKSNIFGVDENAKFEGTRTTIGSGGDVDIKYPTKEDLNLGKLYFDQRAAERLLLKNVRLLNEDNIQHGIDILIEDGKIIELTSIGIEVPDETQKIDCSKLLCLPGLIDFNTHLQWQSHDPTFGVLRNLSQHAVRAGTTTIVETLICPPNVCPFELVDRFKQAILAVENLFWCDVAIRLGMSHLDDVILNEKLPRIVTELGITSFMFYVSVDESGKVIDGIELDQLEKAFKICKELGVISLVRWNGAPINNVVTSKIKTEQTKIELKTCQEIAKIVANTSCPTMMVGLESLPAIQYIQKVSNQIPKLPIRATLSLNLLYSEDLNSYYSSLPILASTRYLGVTSDQSAIIDQNGYTLFQRSIKLWKSLVVNGLIDIPAFINVASTGVAKFIGLYPKKGHIAVGADADLVLWSEDSLFNDANSAVPSIVIMAGEVVAKDGEISTKRPSGIVYPTETFPPLTYELVRAVAQFKCHHPDVHADLSTNSDEITSWLAKQGLEDKNDQANVTNDTPQGITGRRGTGRNLFESSFSLGGTENVGPVRTSIRTHHPPGGSSDTRIW